MLKEREQRGYAECRTQCLVPAAFDGLIGSG